MVSRREMEREKARRFVFDLFWALDSFIESLRGEIRELGRQTIGETPFHARQEMEALFRFVPVVPVSQLSLEVDEAYRVFFEQDGEARLQEEYGDLCVNDAIRETAARYRFEVMGSSVTVADSPRTFICSRRRDLPFEFIMLWLFHTWPDAQINVSFASDNEKVQIIFQDSRCVYERKVRYANLSLLACIIDYRIVVKCHGWCVWPEIGKPRRLEVILPLRPPVAEELDKPPPVWMQNG